MKQKKELTFGEKTSIFFHVISQFLNSEIAKELPITHPLSPQNVSMDTLHHLSLDMVLRDYWVLLESVRYVIAWISTLLFLSLVSKF